MDLLRTPQPIAHQRHATTDTLTVVSTPQPSRHPLDRARFNHAHARALSARAHAATARSRELAASAEAKQRGCNRRIAISEGILLQVPRLRLVS